MHTTKLQLSNTQTGRKSLGYSNQFKKCATVIGIVFCLSLNACGTMTNRGKSTAIGAGVGAVAGAVLTGGSAWGTVGGAAVGGVVGNQVGK